MSPGGGGEGLDVVWALYQGVTVTAQVHRHPPGEATLSTYTSERPTQPMCSKPGLQNR